MGLLRLLSAGDRTDDIAPEGRRRHRDAGQADIRKPSRESAEAGPPRTHHEDPFVLGDQTADRVDDGLCAARAG